MDRDRSTIDVNQCEHHFILGRVWSLLLISNTHEIRNYKRAGHATHAHVTTLSTDRWEVSAFDLSVTYQPWWLWHHFLLSWCKHIISQLYIPNSQYFHDHWNRMWSSKCMLQLCVFQSFMYHHGPGETLLRFTMCYITVCCWNKTKAHLTWLEALLE